MRVRAVIVALCTCGIQESQAFGIPFRQSAFSTTTSSWTTRRSAGDRWHGAGTSRMMSEPEQPKDIVEKIFNVFFGQKEDRPADLGRISVKTFPDQYPAEKDLQAEPVKGDTKDMAVIRPLLKQTELARGHGIRSHDAVLKLRGQAWLCNLENSELKNTEFRKLKLAYSASSSSWKPEAFHKGVDKKGPGIVVAKTKGGAVVGGYNPKGWVGYGEYRPGLSAFLFTWKDGDTSKKAIKLRKVGGAGLAVWDKPECGPLFGSDGFGVNMQKSSPRQARCKLGSYYERLPGGGSNIFSDREAGVAELVDLKVFVGIYAPGEIVPFDDAIPFSIS